MSLTGTLEVYLQFHSLRNVDLFHQGIYQVRTQVYREVDRNEPLVSGIPTRISTNPLEAEAQSSPSSTAASSATSQAASPSRDQHHLASAFINESNRTFSTRSFQIKYCEEEIEINDGITFRFPVDLTRPSSYTAPVYIELDLMYAEAASKSRRRRKSQHASAANPDILTSPLRSPEDGASVADPESRSSELLSLDFVDAAYQVFRVQNPVSGCAEYFQATFDHLHCCVCHCTVITAFTDIRELGRPYTLAPALPVRYNVPKTPPCLTYTKKATEKALPYESYHQDTPQDYQDQMHTYDDEMGLRPQAVTLVEFLSDTVRNLELAEQNADTSARYAREGPTDLLWAESPDMSSNFRPAPRPRVRDQLEARNVVISRCDLVYHEHILLLVRSYFRLRAHLTTLIFRGLSEQEEADIEWLRPEAGFQLPGKLNVSLQPNGLPEPPTAIPAKHKKLTFTLPAHLCLDVADEIFRTDKVAIAGATRHVSLTYLPPSARLPKPRSTADPALSTILQHIITEDFNLIWRQIHEIWHKLRLLCTLARREFQFFHQLVWEKRMSARCKEVIYLEVVSARSACQPVEPDLGLIHSQLAEDLRRSQQFQDLPSLPVEDVHDAFDIENLPIVFEEKYTSEGKVDRSGKGFMERRNRLSSLHGGLAESIPEGTTRAISRQPIMHSAMDPGETILLTHRPNAETTTPFQGLRTLAYMKQAGVLSDKDEHAPTPLKDSSDEDLLPCPDEPSAQCNKRVVSTSTADISLDDSSINPADETAIIGVSDARFLRLNCPVFQELPSAPKIYKGTHLIVFVHGFQGNAMDMRLLRNQISLIFPEALYLSSSANEDHTEGDIALMGKRLAEEVTSYVNDLCPSESVGRISIVAHSLGGVIARAALPYLESYSSKFHTFLTLSSPHLGYTFARNRLVDAGLWVLKKWKKSASLQQLSLGDAKSARDTLLYKMSLFDNLKWFSHVVLLSCIQDQYIPYESARVEISDKVRNDPTWGSVHTEMTQNLMRNVNKEQLSRLDVCFRIVDTRSIDSLIGRTAHIQFLGSAQLAQMLVFTYPYWFA